MSTKETEVKVGKSPKFSKKQISEFKKEIAKKPNEATLKDFLAIIEKKPEDLTDSEIRILIFKMGQLSDDERYKFRKILVRENLTEKEVARYTKIHPVIETFNRFFPTKDNVEEHYKIHFKQGRTEEKKTK